MNISPIIFILSFRIEVEIIHVKYVAIFGPRFYSLQPANSVRIKRTTYTVFINEPIQVFTSGKV